MFDDFMQTAKDLRIDRLPPIEIWLSDFAPKDEDGNDTYMELDTSPHAAFSSYTPGVERVIIINEDVFWGMYDPSVPKPTRPNDQVIDFLAKVPVFRLGTRVFSKPKHANP